MALSNCRKGSAWHSWQLAGMELHGKSTEEIEGAAQQYAAVDPHPLAQNCRYRAFKEGALS